MFVGLRAGRDACRDDEDELLDERNSEGEAQACDGVPDRPPIELLENENAVTAA